MKTPGEFVEGMLREVPELRAIYAQHIEDNGALLPHVLLGNIANETILLALNRSNADVLQKLLDLVELGLHCTNPLVSELVAVSFIENLCGEHVALAAMIPLMGRATKTELRSICGG